MLKQIRKSTERGQYMVTEERFERLYRIVYALADRPLTREQLLKKVNVGLRTFYRELDFLKTCGVPIYLEKRRYVLGTSLEEAEQVLPFYDPRLSFAEVIELAKEANGPAADRLSKLRDKVIAQAKASLRAKTSKSTKATTKSA